MRAQFSNLVLTRNGLGQPSSLGWQQQSTRVPYVGLVLNSLGVGYFCIDRRYNITDTNAPALKWLNMVRESVVGRPFSVVVPQSPMKMLRAAIEEKVFVDRQLNSYQRPDRLIDLHVYPTKDGAIVFFQDLTEHELQRREVMRASEQMAERLRTLREEERQRIAKELHDSTAQHLIAIRLNFMKLKLRLRHKERHSALLGEIETSLQEASKELRTFTYLLHPPKLDDDGFRDTAERYALGFGNRAGLSVSIRITSVSDIAPFEMQRCFFRIIQEALTNVHRHASASKVRIELRHLHQQLHLIVRDNGLGIDYSGPSNQQATQLPMGVGIPGMQERLRNFGGELAVRSGPDGTRVHAIVPFDPRLHKNNRRRTILHLPTTNGKHREILPHQA